MLRGMLAGLLLCVSAAPEAALLGRAPLTPGGTDYQAYYDTDLDITWQADANLSQTESFGLPQYNGQWPPVGQVSVVNGSMFWTTAQDWLAGMNTANYLGVNDWRLPAIVDTGPPGCDAAFSGTDCAWNVDLATSEMAHLYYSTLGNVAYFSTSGTGNQPGWGLVNTGPFAHVRTDRPYWSGTIYAPDPGRSWTFDFNQGGQNHFPDGPLFVWAVRDGDLVQTPLPAAGWLAVPAIGLLAPSVRRRARARR